MKEIDGSKFFAGMDTQDCFLHFCFDGMNGLSTGIFVD